MIGTILALLLLQEAVPAVTPTLQPLSQFTLQCATTGASSSAAYQWQMVEGAASAVFATPNAQATVVSLIEHGTYLLRCVVTDAGKPTTWGDWSLVVGANYIPLPPPDSTVKVSVVQIPPPDTRDNIKPIIAKVMYGAIQLTNGQTVTLTSAVYAGFNVTATDNTAVTSAQLIVRDTHAYSIGLDSALPSAFNVYWLKNPITAGIYPAVIRVYDGTGNWSEFKLTLRR